ncbi:MAG: hypothetical protein DYG92_02400 [Leptolyngbya sp. PLA1]|nr:hypothetical protein [Leptolyngbya sp. PLA1]
MTHRARTFTLGAGLALLCLTGTGCSRGSGFGIFTFGHREGGNIAASDSLGAALASQSQTTRAVAARNNNAATSTASAPSNSDH